MSSELRKLNSWYVFLLSPQQQKDKIIDYGIYSRYQISNIFTDQPRKKSSYEHMVRQTSDVTINYILTIVIVTY